MSLIKDYLEKTKYYKKQYGENTMVLMQVGAFYEVYALQNNNNNTYYGSNILEFIRICDLNIANKNVSINEDKVRMAGFSHYMLDKYIRRLQNEGYTIVVYNQDMQEKNTTRSLAGIYSPGTSFLSDSETKITNNTICIWLYVMDFPHSNSRNKDNIKTIYIGASNIDIYTGKTCMYEFNEPYIKNPTTFDNLERFVSVYNPSEVILIGNMELNEIETIIQYTNIRCNAIHRISLELHENENENENIKRALNCQKQNYQLMILQKYYNSSDFDLFYEYAIAAQSFCFLLDFIYTHNPNLLNKIYYPEIENCSTRLSLANHSLKQLNIIDDYTYKGKLSSVEKFLNNCVTSMGKRLFSYNLLNPTTNVEELNIEYDMIDYLINNSSILEYIKSNIQNIKDLDKLSRLIMIKKITPCNFYQIYENIIQIKKINKYLLNDEALQKYITHKNSISNIGGYCSHLITAIDDKLKLDICKNIDNYSSFEENFFNKGIYDKLDEKNCLYLDSMDILESIKNYFNKLVSKAISKNESVNSNNEFFKIYCTEKNNIKIIGTKRRCALLKKELENITNPYCTLDYISSYSKQKKQFNYNTSISEHYFYSQSTQNDCINNSTIEELIQNITSSKLELKDELNNCYKIFLQNMESYQDVLKYIINYVTLLDIITSKTLTAIKYNYCKPTIKNIDDTSYVDVTGIRHCLIEQLQQDELYVTNDISLGKSEKGILLYGTNAVGKTSFIRALGISVIMAQAGLYVPCSTFTFFPYQHIFTRILGNDNLFKGLSTFAVEMSELRTILRMSNNNSLILGDELCSGTESVSAISIFVAGIKQLYEKRCSFIFATHWHEIINYSEIKELTSLALKHMTVFFNKETNKLQYDRKLKDGPGDSMYGLEVCKSLSLPLDFLELAHSIRNKYNPNTQSILSLKTSHFNNKKIMGMCEVCNKEMGTEVHHIHHQKNANNEGYIKTESHVFHKNHLANLMTLCEKCHQETHHKYISKNIHDNQAIEDMDKELSSSK